MNSLSSTRGTLAVLLLLAVSGSITLPASAAKRRAVAHKPRPAEVTGSVKGRVTDAVTGLPVIRVRVEAGGADYTDANGDFEIKSAKGYGEIEVEASRTGYVVYRTRLAAGDHVVNFQMQPTATATVRTTGGAEIKVDYDSLAFGYPVPFSGYRKAYHEDFCVNGATVQIHKSDMKRITGPATFVDAGSCCDDKPQIMKMSIELKGKAPADYLFADSCFIGTTTPVDVIGINHQTGEDVYIHLTEVSEIVFP